MPKKILVTRDVGEHAMSILRQSEFNLIVNPEDAAPSRPWVLNHLRDPDVVAVCMMHSQPSDKVDQEFVDACNENLKCISTFSVGYDHINVKAVKQKGVRLGHTPNVLNDAVADITVMLVLMTMRRVQEGIDLVKTGGWPNLPWAPFVMCGPSISHPNLTIGFIGFGRISHFVVRRLLAFTNTSRSPSIIYLSSRRRDNQDEIDKAYTAEFGVDVRRVEKDQVAEKSDVVIVLCDQNPGTMNLVNREFLGRMKKTAVLVNCARGPIVNSDDLADALEAKQIFGAGLDVITGEPNITGDHRLVKLSNCVVIPHMGSGDIDTRNAMAERCVRNAIQGARGEEMPAEII